MHLVRQSGVRRTDRLLTQQPWVCSHECSGRPYDYLLQITLQAPVRGASAWLAACTSFVNSSSQRDKRRLPCVCPQGSQGLIVRRPLTFPISITAHGRVARSLFPLPRSRLPFPHPSFSRCMPDITPSTPASAQPPTTSSNNAQFLNAVTRGDEHHARSLLARGADVNAMDATGRSAVACVLAGERCAAAAAVCVR